MRGTRECAPFLFIVFNGQQGLKKIKMHQNVDKL